MIPVGFETEAEDDARAAFDWYEEHQRGLGVRFFDAVSAAVDRIAEAPHAYPEGYRGLGAICTSIRVHARDRESVVR